MQSYLLISGIVLLIGVTLWLVTGILITYLDPENAAKIIAALGEYFPFRRR